MNRREVVTRFAFLFGGAFVFSGTSILANEPSGMSDGETKKFNKMQQDIIDAIADTIIPTTSTPGASAAGVGPFIIMMIEDCYPAGVHKTFAEGIERVNGLSLVNFGKAFNETGHSDRESILIKLGDEVRTSQIKNTTATKPDLLSQFLRLVRELTFLGYFTSEIGSTQALNYVATPGTYDGCVPFKKGQKAWVI
ncbi:MAG TPA: gluconate 2-dehydrogenase subunit 3 family protein [Daejeonella sp.]|uniref:gluconate 2-dehydrogenase subunit 3 family protein n=1 Tax=Daejeonella sp. TaxID=2805397 RepID=UPI002ED838E9